MNTRAVILVATGIAIGGTGAYVGGIGLSQAAVNTTQHVATTIDVPFYGNAEDYPSLSERGIINRWVKKWLMAPLETQYGITAGTLSPCSAQAKITIVYTPMAEDPAWCTISASADGTLPGEFVAGSVGGGQ